MKILITDDVRNYSTVHDCADIDSYLRGLFPAAAQEYDEQQAADYDALSTFISFLSDWEQITVSDLV